MQSGGLDLRFCNPSQSFLRRAFRRCDFSSSIISDYGGRVRFSGGAGLGDTNHVWECQADDNRADRGWSHHGSAKKKQAGLLLQNRMLCLKSAGGVKLDEPAIDLAVAVSHCFPLRGQTNQPAKLFRWWA